MRPVCSSIFSYGFQNGLNRTVSVLRERLCRNSYFMDSPRVVRAHKKVEDRTLGAWTTLRSRASESERREKNTHNETKRAGTARGFRSDYKWKDQRESNSGPAPYEALASAYAEASILTPLSVRYLCADNKSANGNP